jgi:signal transduction histidine kinase
MADMDRGQLARLMRARHAPQVGVALLAVAGFGQAIAQAVALGAANADKGVPASVLSMLYALPLCTLALLSVLPLAFLRPAAAAVVVVAANVLVLGTLTTPTVAGAAAALIAVARLGAVGQVAAPRWLTARGDGSRGHGPAAAVLSAAGGAGAQFLAVGLGVPFLLLALAERSSTAAVLLAAAVPLAAGAGIAARARGADRTYSAAANALADTLLAHSARGERARIARELHDVVAHHITMISVQAETARLTTPGLPDSGARRLAEIGDTARAGLTEMRRLLGVLRDDAEDAGAAVVSRQPQPGLPQLAELVDAARDASGGRVRLIVSGAVTVLDPGVELAAYRIVQEALTNARRHAAGAAVDVELRYDSDALRLRIRDNGPGPAACAPAVESPGPAGHGLLGMRERALAVGGKLHTGPAAGGGFVVAAELPARPDSAATPPTSAAGLPAGSGVSR